MQIRYLKHLLSAKGPDRIHSPFVFDLYYLSLLGDFLPYQLLNIEKSLGNTKIKKKNILCLKALYVLINKFKPKSILHLGKDASRSVLHASSFQNETTVHYLVETSDLQKEYLKENILPLKKTKNISAEMLVFSSAADLNELDLSESKLFLVLSLFETENQKLWLELSKNERFNVLLDCYFFGIGFYKPKQVNEYFRLRF